MIIKIPMEQQKIFRQFYNDSLVQKVKSGESISLFQNSEFHVDDRNILIMPHMEKPLFLLSRLNPDKDFDFQSAIALFEAFKNLTPLEAADPKFWNYISLIDLYPYLRSRWPNVYNRIKGTNAITYVFDHYLLQDNSSDIMRVHLPSLWWSVDLSIDESHQDKYHLTKILFWNQTLRTRTMGSYLFARKRELALGFLDYLEIRGEDNFGNFEKEHQILTEFINKTGGSKSLTFFTRDEICQLLIKNFPLSNMISLS